MSWIDELVRDTRGDVDPTIKAELVSRMERLLELYGVENSIGSMLHAYTGPWRVSRDVSGRLFIFKVGRKESMSFAMTKDGVVRVFNKLEVSRFLRAARMTLILDDLSAI
jgi:hypothetical protein